MKRLWINRKPITKLTNKIVGSIYAILGFISLFVSFDGMLSSLSNIWEKILVSTIILSAVWLFCYIVSGVILINKKRFEIISANNGYKLYIQYGNIFDEKVIINSLERRNIVIPVNRCFDTIVDNDLISEKTLHGDFLKKLYAQNIYTENSLNIKIQQKLANMNYKTISKNDKPRGNRKRYDVGTIINLPISNKENYLLWGLSSFDNQLKAYTTMQEYVLAVQKLIEACNTESEGFPVVIPLVGAGLSRTNKGQEDIISYLINAFKLNKSEINCDIHIVIKEELKNEISIIDIK